MIYKNLNIGKNNTYVFSVNKTYSYTSSDINNDYECEFTNSFPRNDSYEQNYVNYVWLDSIFYKNYYKNRIKSMNYISKYQQRHLGIYSYFIQINNNVFNSLIKPTSISMDINSYEIIDDGYGNLINKSIYNSIEYSDFISYFNILNKYSILNYSFDELKYFTSNRSNGIVKTLKYDDNNFIYDNTIYDITGLGNNMSFFNNDINLEIYNDNYYIKLYSDDSYVITENTSLKKAFQNDFTIFLEFNYIDGVNGEISLFKRYTDNNALFEIVIDSNINKLIFNYIINGITKSINVDFDVSVLVENPTIILQRTDSDFVLRVLTSTIDEENSLTVNLNDIMFNIDMDIELSTPSLPNYFNASLKNLQIIEYAIDLDLYKKYKYINKWMDNYYFGNVFYENGIITITNSTLAKNIIDDLVIISNLEFKNTKYIYEHEYICTIDINDFNYTLNKTALKINSDEYLESKANYTIPNYVTTIGLYDNDDNLILVGKINKPIERIKNLPMNFIIKYDL